MAQPVENSAPSGSTLLLRRIKPTVHCVELVGDNVRPTSVVFRDSRGQLSVSLDVPGKLEEFNRLYPDSGVLAFTVQCITDLGYHVVPDPLPNDPEHYIIRDPRAPERECLGKNDARDFARSDKFTWRYQPPGLLEIARAKAGPSPI